jgi:hypothetical protein
MIIGSWLTSSFADGSIDEPIIFGIELSPTEVSELYNSGTVYDYSTHSRYADCISWWRMGDDARDDLTSITGIVKDQKNINDGTPINTEASDKVEDTP